MVKILNKNLRINSFTHWNILSLLYCIYFQNFNNFYCITNCWSWTIFITFHMGYIYDNTAYIRIQEKIKCNFFQFHIGNFILHTMPIFYIVNKPPLIIINYYHSSFATFMLILWVYISTRGSMDLSDIYVKFTNKTVKKLYITSIITCLNSPLLYIYCERLRFKF